MRSLLLPLLFLACSEPSPPLEQRPPLPSPEEVRGELEPLSFDDFVVRSFEHLLVRSPESAIDLGLDLDVGDSFLDDISAPFVEETFEVQEVILEQLRAHDRALLSSDRQVTYDVYEWWLDDRLRDRPFVDLDYLVMPTFGAVHVDTAFFFTDVHPLETEEDAEAYVARLWRVEEKLAQVEELLLAREAAGIIAPRPPMEWGLAQIEEVAASEPRFTPYYAALLSRGAAVAGDDLLARAKEAIEASVKPAYASLAALVRRLASIAPEEDGIWQLPGGDLYYAHLLRHHTTLDVSADELHQLGLDELARLHAELDQHFAALGYPRSAPLRDKILKVELDGGIVPEGEIVPAYEAILDDAYARLDQAFDIQPSAALVVIGGATGGFYLPPALDGSRPGAFYAAVSSRGEPRFGMRTLAYHEGVPGHHLQIGIAQDLDLPLVRRLIGFTGFDEGWALYAEWLAGDLGWYQDDRFGEIGRLQAEAFRAARLVVDTGLHAKEWSFEQAVAFMEENVGFSAPAARGQISRYVSWPGQATAYHTGALRFRALRSEAETALGDQFDLRAFHRAALTEGSLPLDVLSAIVRARLAL